MNRQTDKTLIDGLSRFQKILLITDGTVTKLLENHLGEAISVQKINEEKQAYDNNSHQVTVDLQGSLVLEREILLQGQTSKTHWLYAKSTIFLKHLQQDFLSDLVESNQPIGKLWSKYRLETYKEILATSREEAGELAKYFNIKANDVLISRTYSVYSNQKIIMIITEKFPLSYFCD